MKTLFMCLAFMTANGGHRLSTLVINIFNKEQDKLNIWATCIWC